MDAFEGKGEIVPIMVEPGLQEKAEKVLHDTMQKVTEEARANGGFYKTLSESQREVVDDLVEQNHPYYFKHHGVDIGVFREAMSENYLVKTRVFAPVVEIAGYTKFDGEASDKTEFACLTRNASYAMTGEGCYNGEGGSLIYTRLPLREGDPKATNVTDTSGVTFQNMPAVGERLFVWRPNGHLNTSSLTDVYARNTHSGETIDAVAHTIHETYTGIDHKTLTGFKKK